MSRASRGVRKLLDKADDQPTPAGRRTYLEQAIALADEAADTESAYVARMRLISTLYFIGDTEAMLTAFGWCLGMNERDPVRHPAVPDDECDLHWAHKWMAGNLAASPRFPRADIEASLDLMDRKYREAGLGRSGVLQSRFGTALSLGDLELAARLHAEMGRTPRDDYSDCEACVPAAEAEFFFATGDDARGLAKLDEVLGEQLTCTEQPECLMADSLVPLLRAGRLDDARRLHLTSYRLLRDSTDELASIGDHLVFCAVTGNAARGLTLLERHLHWLAHDRLDRSSHFAALTAMAVLLDAVDRDGHGDLVVRAAADQRLATFFPPRSAGAPWTVTEVAARCWSLAGEIGQQFDRRNGNSRFADRLAERRALATESYDVPVGTESIGAPVTSAVRTAASAEVALPVDADGWSERAFALATLNDDVGATEAATRALAADPTPDEAIRVIGLQLQQVATATERGTETPEFADLLAVRATRLREDDRAEQAAGEERFGRQIFGVPASSDVPALLEAADASGSPHLRAELRATAAIGLLAADDAPPRARVLGLVDAAVADATSDGVRDNLRLLRAHALLDAGRGDEAVAAFGELVASGDLDTRINARRGRAAALGSLDRAAEGLVDAEVALDLAMSLGTAIGTADAAALVAQLLHDAGRSSEAVARMQHAVRAARRAGGAPITAHRLELAHLLLQADRPDEAADELALLLDDVRAHDRSSDDLARVSLALAHARREVGDDGRAHEAFLEAADRFVVLGDLEGAAVACAGNARLMVEHDDPAALEVADAALLHAKAAGDARVVLEALHTLGFVRASLGRRGALKTLDQAEALAVEIGDDGAVADVLDTRVLALGVAGKHDELVRVALRAADAYRGVGNEVGAGMNEFAAASALHEQGRADEAVVLFAAALEAVASQPSYVATVGFTYGDALEDLGRHGEAAEVRRRAEQATQA